jgi:hypothetical protein
MNNDKSVAVLKVVAGLPTADTHAGVMDGNNTRNRAQEALAEYYMQRGAGRKR